MNGKSDTLGNLCIYIGAKEEKKKASTLKREKMQVASSKEATLTKKEEVKWPFSFFQQLRSFSLTE